MLPVGHTWIPPTPSASLSSAPASPPFELPRLAARMEERRDGRFKVLSMDGGGIRGIIPLKVLAALQRALNNEPLSHTFDLISGTSTGGIIALGLVSPLNQTPATLLEIYENQSARIFAPHSMPLVARAVQAFVGSGFARILGDRPLYSSTGIYDLAHEYLGRHLLREAHTNILIPAVNITHSHRPSLEEFTNLDRKYASLTMPVVACATSAAPTYFPSHFINAEEYVDGGLGANNPSLLCHLLAMHHGIPPAAVHVVSLGTGYAETRAPPQRRRQNILHWARRIFSTVDGVASSYVDKTLRLHLGEGRYWRINPSMEREIDLADNSPDTLRYLSDIGDALVEEHTEAIRTIARTLRPDLF